MVEPSAYSEKLTAESADWCRFPSLGAYFAPHPRDEPYLRNDGLGSILDSVQSLHPPRSSFTSDEDVEHHGPPVAASDQPPGPSTRRSRLGRPRRQNHSCDQCRSGKRACDLPLDLTIHRQRPSAVCSQCNIRGIECTVAWLARKQALQQSSRQTNAKSRNAERNKAVEPTGTTEKDEARGARVSVPAIVSPISKASEDLTGQLLARQACSERFGLYVDIVDMPMSECLRQGSMPPQYSFGIAAWALLGESPQMSTYFGRANTWIQSCWDTDTDSNDDQNFAAPHLFRAVSLLDTIFQRENTETYSASMASRDAAITEAYKWVAVASAAQLAVDQDRSGTRGDSNAGLCTQQAQDIAYSAWRKAKHLVFGNLAAVSSFRLALAMLLFGKIVPLKYSTGQEEFEEDSAYAFCQGVWRLRRLCAGARARLMAQATSGGHDYDLEIEARRRRPTPTLAHSLQSDIKGNVSELIGAIEWLITMLNSVKIGISLGKLGALPVEAYMSADDDPRPQTDKSQQYLVSFLSGGFEDSILSHVKQREGPFTVLWVNGLSDDTIVRSIRQLAALVVLIWKDLAHLVLVSRASYIDEADLDVLHKRYVATITLIKLWRSAFGVLSDTMRYDLQNLHFSLWRLVAFSCIDTELAVLIFCEVSQNIETRLVAQASTPGASCFLNALQSTSAYRKKESLLSSQQVALISSTCRGVSRPGHQGTTGLKAYVQDICAHPVGATPLSMITCS
ncbi:hypothetical protein N7474_002973 [Penicillium riverlandense]|uniref:uncharacterized protein n=1 Tax=Penicillium riverlandense TaxID=1903569 RepID=UPI0025474D1C|nr:uncharacterized protein N7474_002973 [Penicillium riverlandense]KAJ5825835.1 hypothetical protein N7474_002973 [Penicillium riverlandense]